MKTHSTPPTTTPHSAFKWINQKLRHAAQLLNRRLARYSASWQILIMVGIVALLALANAGILWRTIHSDRQFKVSIQAIPFSSLHSDHPDSVLTQQEYQKLLWFNHLLDSLRTDPASQSIYRELMELHPGIRDSIDYLLKYYPPNE